MKKTILAFLILFLAVSAWAVTFEMDHNDDDSWGVTYDASSQNIPDVAYESFGRYDVTAVDYYSHAFTRYASDIPRGSIVISAKLHFLSAGIRAGAFSTTILELTKDNKWETSNGFNLTSYPTGNDIIGIATGITVARNNVEAWTTDTWYYSPEIKTILQAQINDATYNPGHAEDKYVGYRIDDGDGAPITDDTKRRLFYSHNSSQPEASELVVTYVSGAQVINVTFTGM